MDKFTKYFSMKAQVCDLDVCSEQCPLLQFCKIHDTSCTALETQHPDKAYQVLESYFKSKEERDRNQIVDAVINFEEDVEGKKRVSTAELTVRRVVVDDYNAHGCSSRFYSTIRAFLINATMLRRTEFVKIIAMGEKGAEVNDQHQNA